MFGNAAMSVPAKMFFDPARPIPRLAGSLARASAAGAEQRKRRATILAAIRQLLTEEGYEALGVRRIAECSGHAVQTIYNLVGPRDVAITEAISEYSQYVILSATPEPENPNAPFAMIDREVKSIELSPNFCRNVCRIYFTEARGIFYEFRARQIKILHQFLAQQQRSGIIRAEVNTSRLAEHLILLGGTMFMDWADRPCTFEVLQQRLYAGYANLMSDAMTPGARRAELFA